MKESAKAKVDLETELRPETDLERQLLREPSFVKGLHWGIPRYGHPEGQVYKHIEEVTDNIEKLSIGHSCRHRLRLIAFAHDTFKYCEDKSSPRDWSKHHGIYARRFMEKFIDDPVVLDIIELHDEAYYCWRHQFLYQQFAEGEQRLHRLFDRIGYCLQLYYLFFACDTRTGDKNQAPLKWFEKTVDGIELINR